MQPWEIASCPEEAGVSSKGILSYLDAVEKAGIEHHSILVLRNGKLACKMNFAPYDDQTPHVLFSLSKSFCSAAAGFAVQEGLLRWDSRVLEVLSDKAPENPSEWLQSVTLHHLLTMGSGLDPRSDAMHAEGDWVRDVLNCGCNAEPGTRFHYNSHGTYLVSAMVQRVTGMNIRDYLWPRLFEPLGIPKPEWDTCPDGICTGGWGLHLSSDSIARFGQCLLQKGMWQGRQVLPLEWLEKATSKQIENAAKEPDLTSDWQQGYGYQFWRTRGERYRGDGMYGQICMISEKLNMVVAITAGLNDMATEMNLLNDYLFPAAEMENGTAEEQEQLKLRLAGLAYPWPSHEDDASCLADGYAGEDVELALDAFGVTLRFRQGSLPVEFRMGWFEPEISLFNSGVPGAPDTPAMGMAGWKDGVLSLLVRTAEAPFTVCGRAIPAENGLELTLYGIGMQARTIWLPKR